MGFDSKTNSSTNFPTSHLQFHFSRCQSCPSAVFVGVISFLGGLVETPVKPILPGMGTAPGKTRASRLDSASISVFESPIYFRGTDEGDTKRGTGNNAPTWRFLLRDCQRSGCFLGNCAKGERWQLDATCIPRHQPKTR